MVFLIANIVHYNIMGNIPCTDCVQEQGFMLSFHSSVVKTISQQLDRIVITCRLQENCIHSYTKELPVCTGVHIDYRCG